MKLPSTFKCGQCGTVVPLAEALLPPVPPDQAKPKPCAKCGATAWVPA